MDRSWRDLLGDSHAEEFPHPKAPAGAGTGPGFAAIDYLPPGVPHPDSPEGHWYDFRFELPRLSILERIAAVRSAVLRAPGYVPAAVLETTGEALGKVLAGITPGILTMLETLAVTTLLGAAGGAAVGSLAAGAGAVPGAIAGGGLGLEAGLYLLDLMGLGFLAVYVGESLGEGAAAAKHALAIAWRSVDWGPGQRGRIELAAKDLAYAFALVLRGLLVGIVGFITAKGAGRAAEQVPEVVRTIRSSRLGGDFANWVASNWERLVKSERLRRPLAKRGGGGGAEEVTDDAAPTPPRTSPRAAKPEPEKPKPDEKPKTLVKKAPVSPKARQYILDGSKTGGGHGPGRNKPGKSEFPADWSDDDVIDRITDVANDPASSRFTQSDGRIVTTGTRNGINIRVISESDGSVMNGYPTNVPRNPK